MSSDPNLSPLTGLPKAKELDPPQMRLSLAEARARASARPGPLEQMFFEHSGRLIDKWVHYLPFYDEVFAPYRGRPVRMLEIGVFFGGSLDLWRNYFGPDATLYGVDINPECSGRVTPPNQVRIGSQDDAAFLQSVVDEMGGVDIVLDDGSHVAQHQLASFKALWPRLNAGGVYLIEDMHTSYWPRWEGGYNKPGTATGLVKQIVDDMHGWYHGRDEELVARDEVGAVLVGDSICAIRKTPPRAPPGHVQVGSSRAS